MAMKKIGERLKAERLERNLSQAQFGRAVGKSKQLVSAWENGRAEILTRDLLKLSEQFAIELQWLFSKDHNSAPKHKPPPRTFSEWWREMHPQASLLIARELQSTATNPPTRLVALEAAIRFIDAVMSTEELGEHASPEKSSKG